jgi:hypothetical protein
MCGRTWAPERSLQTGQSVTMDVWLIYRWRLWSNIYFSYGQFTREAANYAHFNPALLWHILTDCYHITYSDSRVWSPPFPVISYHWHRSKVKVSTNMKNTLLVITFEPIIIEISNWYQNASNSTHYHIDWLQLTLVQWPFHALEVEIF